MRLLLVYAMSVMLLSCGNNEQTEEAIRPVYYQIIGEANISGSRSFAGVSQAENEAKLSFKVGGTLEDIHFKLGEPVKKGSVIAHLNDADYKINYQKAVSSKENAEIQLASSKSSFDRTEKLYAGNSASLSDYEKVKSQYESAKTMLKSSKSQLKAAKNQLDYTQLIAPFDGSISNMLTKEKEMIGAGMPVIMFSSNGNVEVRSQVPENIIKLVELGQNVTVEFTVLKGEVFEGVISEIGRSTGGSSTYPIVIDLLDVNEEVLPGMACSIKMQFQSKQESTNSIVVSADAVAHDEGGDFVYILKASEEKGFFTAVRKSVSLGELTPEGYEINEGLNTGEMIVTAGLSFMYDGRKVRLLE